MLQEAPDARRYRSEVRRSRGNKKIKKSKTSAKNIDTATKLDSVGGATPMLSPSNHHERMIELKRGPVNRRANSISLNNFEQTANNEVR